MDTFEVKLWILICSCISYNCSCIPYLCS